MLRLITSIIANIAALYVAGYFVPGFVVSGGWKEYLMAGAVLGLLNLIVKPILKLVALPLMVLTFGLFTLVINAALLWGVSWLFPSVIAIIGWQALAWGTLIVTIANFLAAHAKKSPFSTL